MDYSIFARPNLPDWQKGTDTFNRNQAYLAAQNALAGGDYSGAQNALIGVGEVGKANMFRQWQDQERNRGLAQEAGGLYAGGDTKGAMNAALKGGNFGLAGQVQGLHQNAANQQLAEANRALEKTGALLASIKTPEQWNMAKQAAVASGRYSPEDVAKIDQQIAAQGLQPTLSYYHSQILGTQGQLAEAEKKRKETVSALGRLGAQYQNKPGEWSRIAQAFSAAHGNPQWLQPYLGPDGLQLALSEAGATGTKFGMNPVYYTDPKTGELKIAQLSSGGGAQTVQVPGQVRPPVAIKDTGTEQTAINTRTGEVLGTVKKNVEEAARLQKRGQEKGKFEGEKPQKFMKASQAIADLDRAHTLVDQDIDRAISMIEGGSVPLTGMFAIGSVVPGTPAYNLAEVLKGVKANVSFDKLQAMREASPTGGALGQVSDFENKLLQATSGSLDQAQTGQQLLFNLRRLKQQLKEMGGQRRAAFERDFADQIKGRQVSPSRPSGPAPGTIEDGYRFKGGNPAQPSNWEPIR